MAALQIEDWNKWIYVHIYLEPVCPLFWGLNPPKQGPNFKQNKGPHLGSRYILLSSIEFKNTSNECTNLKYPEIAYKILVHISTEDDRPPDMSPLGPSLGDSPNTFLQQAGALVWYTLQGTLGKKGKSSSKYTLGGDMLVSRRVGPKKHNILIWFTGIRKKKRRLIIITKNHTRSRIIPPIYSK